MQPVACVLLRAKDVVFETGEAGTGRYRYFEQCSGLIQTDHISSVKMIVINGRRRGTRDIDIKTCASGTPRYKCLTCISSVANGIVV
jgi:hypothetical protein